MRAVDFRNCDHWHIVQCKCSEACNIPLWKRMLFYREYYILRIWHSRTFA